MIQTTVRLERPEGTPRLTAIAVQIEELSERERLDLQDARPFDLCAIYTLQGVPSTPIQRRDVLFDERNTDPETGQPYKYRVVSAVETFDADHQELLAERVVGG
jgi:hypothetical protein